MGRSFEYKFVRLGEYGGSALFGVHDKTRNAYDEVVHEHARDGWRLVQIFAPGRRRVRRRQVLRAHLRAGAGRGRDCPHRGRRERVGSAERA